MGFASSSAGVRFDWRRVLVKEYGTIFVLVAAFACLRIWSEYAVLGADALPSRSHFVVGALTWIALYLGTRALKKRRYISG